MLQGPGENAGVLDLGDGLAVTFKAESHNHPSAVEPFQGAATGVGGILRDIIAMGARPIALLDGLRFGAPDDHFSRAVGGIGAYGNSVGVPNVGGEVVFDDVYASNCLVNAMCVGLLPADSVMSARADTAGALLVLYGATTGRDGIGGASVLASQELGEEAADKRPSVQVGDPFTGKRLIEVSVELVERGLVLSLQDCGAAGPRLVALRDGGRLRHRRPPRPRAAARGGHGAVGDHDLRVAGADGRDRRARAARRGRGRDRPLGAPPRRDRRGDRDRRAARAVARRGRRHDPGPLPHRGLPALRRRARAAASRAPRCRCRALPPTADVLLELLGSDALRSRAFVTRRYDQLVQSRTVRRPGLDAAVLRLRPSFRGLALTLDGTGRVGSLDPFTGGAAAILEAARNVACAGGEPLGFTDCLNFGNPEKPEIGWELAESIEGMAQACEALALPIVSGNVSLYNDTDGRSIHPDAGRGLRRARARRSPRSRRLEAGRRDHARLGRHAGLPRLGAAGALRHRLRHAADARPRGPRRR